MTLTRSPGPGSGLDPLLERLQRGVDDDPLGLALQHAQHGNLDVHRQSIGDEGVGAAGLKGVGPVSYTHLRAHETDSYLVCRLLLEKKTNKHASYTHLR